jgi:hypothetical protein
MGRFTRIRHNTFICMYFIDAVLHDKGYLLGLVRSQEDVYCRLVQITTCGSIYICMQRTRYCSALSILSIFSSDGIVLQSYGKTTTLTC